MPLKITVLILIGLVLRGAPSHGDNAVAKRHYKRGMAAYALEDWDGALREFEIGFRDEPSPAFLYNMAQAQRMAKRPDAAIKLYKRYLEMTPETAADRGDIVRLIATLERKLEADRRPSPPPPATAAPAPQIVQLAIVSHATATAPGGSPWYRDGVAIGLVAGGLVVAAIGGGLVGWAAALDGEARSAPDLAQREEAWARAGTVAPAGYALLGIGGAAIVGGVVKWAVRPRATAREPRLSWLLDARPGFVGGAVGGSF